MVTRELTEILRKQGYFRKDTLAELKKYEKLKLGNVLDFCYDNGILTAETAHDLVQQHSLPVIDLTRIEVDQEAVRLLPASVCFEHFVVPFYQDSDNVYVAMVDPEDQNLVSFIKQAVRRNVVPYLTHRNAVKHVLQTTFNRSAEDSRDQIVQLIERAQAATNSPEVMAQQVPIISLLNHLIVFGLRSKASDLHIEPRDESVVIRYRIDGMLHEQFTLPQAILAPLIARVKILARMRIDEHLRPQDGRFTFEENNFRVAVRVSVIPILHGQKAALRFLDTDNEELSIGSLGLSRDHQAQLTRILGNSNGLVLVTGPTGSGKTTTLYALLKAIAKKRINISTIEDPIEYHLDGANQMQVNTRVGVTFADGLRSLLRQDPDVIMVGEIRDTETARIAVNAALTGHLVFSSLHTNSAAAAIPRLIDMGVEPFLVASTLRCVVGQRLVRRICVHCKAEYTMSLVPQSLGEETVKRGPLLVSKGKGCDHCLHTGYFGRTGIYEILMVEEYLHDLIINRAPASAIEQAGVNHGLVTLRNDGTRKVNEHMTTVEEVIRSIQ